MELRRHRDGRVSEPVRLAPGRAGRAAAFARGALAVRRGRLRAAEPGSRGQPTSCAPRSRCAAVLRITAGVARRTRTASLRGIARLCRDSAVRRCASRNRAERGARRRCTVSALRLGDGATARDQAARPATQAATRTVFALGGFVGACAFACVGLAMCVIGTNGALGFGRIAVVGMCQNNLNCVRSRARRRRVKKSGRW